MQFCGVPLLLLFAIATSHGEAPDDNLSIWPPPSEVAALGKRLKGEVKFPGSLSYDLGTVMMNTRFNSRFGIVVRPESTEDVREVILFCKRYGIRPTVKSSGHDYIGRSSGVHTVSINLSQLKKIAVQSDSRSPTGVSAIVEPGNAWGDVYKNLHEAGYLIVGGSAQTVSPGGYTLGGGHSPMSRKFGLAVDNVIEFTLVTPDGSIIKQTATGGTILRPGAFETETYNDPELFWAARGGGGGTYGVVTSYTYQIHEPPEDGFCRYLAMYPMIFNGRKVGEEILGEFSTYLLNNMTDNWGGYVLPSAYKGSLNISGIEIYAKGLLTFSLLHVGGCEEAQPELDFLWNLHPRFAVFRSVLNYTTFWDYEKEINDPIYYRTYIINRFLQPEDLENPDKLAEVIGNTTETRRDIGCSWTLLGGKVSRMPVSSSAVSPHFRSSLGSLSCGVGWGNASEDTDYIAAMQEYGEQLYTVGRGVYFNEPDQFLEDWKEEYWGAAENYERLLSVKQQYDPNQMFWCHHCVGSDLRPAMSVFSSAPTRALSIGGLWMVSLVNMVFRIM